MRRRERRRREEEEGEKVRILFVPDVGVVPVSEARHRLTVVYRGCRFPQCTMCYPLCKSLLLISCELVTARPIS